MKINEYQSLAMQTRTQETYDEQNRIIYPTLGLTGEAGEVADKVKKVMRDNQGDFDEEKKNAIALELGDVMWYAAALAYDLGYSLEEICEKNIQKVFDRKSRNKTHGSGDYR